MKDINTGASYSQIAPMAANIFGRSGPEFFRLRFLWAVADYAAQVMSLFLCRSCQYSLMSTHQYSLMSTHSNVSNVDPPDEHDCPQVVSFNILRGILFVQARLHLTAVYEAVTHQVYEAMAESFYFLQRPRTGKHWLKSLQSGFHHQLSRLRISHNLLLLCHYQLILLPLTLVLLLLC
jgi:hypothetical protein